MCGIAAFIANKGVETKEVMPFIKMIAILQDSRGRDNAGVAFLNKSGNISILRGAEPRENFTDKDDSTISNLLFNRGSEIEERISDIDLIFLGHSRKASVGSTTLDNTHPFTFPNTGLYGVHNGTIKNTDEMAEYLGIDVKDCATDSQAIFKMINEKSYEQVFPLYDNSFQRGGAFVWGYSGKDFLNVYVGYNSLTKDQERPLHYLVCPYGTFISSELKHLEVLAVMFLNTKFNLEDIALGAFKTNQLHVVKGSKIETVGEEIVKNIQHSSVSYSSYSSKSSSYTNYGVSSQKSNSDTRVLNNLVKYRLTQLRRLKAPYIHNGRYAYNNKYLCNTLLLPGESFVMIELPDYISLSEVNSNTKIDKNKTSFKDTYSIAVRTAENKFYFIDKPNSLFVKPKKKVIEVNFFRGMLMNDGTEWQVELEEVGSLADSTIKECSISPYPVRSVLNGSLTVGTEFTVCLKVNDTVLDGHYHYPFTNIAGTFKNGTAFLYFLEKKNESCSC